MDGRYGRFDERAAELAAFMAVIFRPRRKALFLQFPVVITMRLSLRIERHIDRRKSCHVIVTFSNCGTVSSPGKMAHGGSFVAFSIFPCLPRRMRLSSSLKHPRMRLLA